MKTGILFFIFFFTQWLSAGIVINELMPAPLSDEPEWLEIYNSSDSTITYPKLLISNQNAMKTTGNISFPPKCFTILTSDPAKLLLKRKIPASAYILKFILPTLHNSYDPIVIKDKDSNVIDSIYYDMNLGKKGISFERKDFSKPAVFSDNLAMTLSPDSATCGYENSYLFANTNIPLGSIVINEYLYNEGDSSAEFVEFYNVSMDSIRLNGWVLSNRQSGVGYDNIFITGRNCIIPPLSYFVITWDTMFFKRFPELKGNPFVKMFNSNMNLKVSGDELMLKDAAGKIQDKVIYSDDVESKDLGGRKDGSIERVSVSVPSSVKSNWISCGYPRGATPLEENSISILPKNQIVITAEPNPFSPNDKGNKQVSMINYKLPFRSARIKCSVFDSDGLMLKELVNNEYTSTEGTIIWDGRDREGRAVGVGPYILLIEAVDTRTGESAEKKMLIVVGE